jgi:hypothetical protein
VAPSFAGHKALAYLESPASDASSRCFSYLDIGFASEEGHTHD